MSDQSPLIKTLSAHADAVAAGSDATVALFRAPFDGTVTSVTYAADADITGANTNTRTLSVVNKKQNGNGSTTVASLALASGNNCSDYDEAAITLSGTAANLTVAEGDILAFASIHAASGLADPGGLVSITISRD